MAHGNGRETRDGPDADHKDARFGRAEITAFLSFNCNLVGDDETKGQVQPFLSSFSIGKCREDHKMSQARGEKEIDHETEVDHGLSHTLSFSLSDR